MKNIILFSTALSLLFIASCRRSENIEPNKDIRVLFERFDGKYRVVNCTSTEPVDLNRDGVRSENLMTEIDLQNAELEIRISSNFIFVQNWPEAYLLYGVPDSTVNYANQGVAREFDFDREIQHIDFRPDDLSIDQQRFAVPRMVVVRPGDYIEVTTTKRLYTAAGWKNVDVTVLYKRYT